MWIQTLTKSLAQILSRNTGFYDKVTKRKGYVKTINLTLTLASIPTVILTLTKANAIQNEILFSVIGHVTKVVNDWDSRRREFPVPRK